MSIIYGGDFKIPPRALENFAEYFFEKFREDPEHILLVSNGNVKSYFPDDDHNFLPIQIDGATGQKYSRKWILQQTNRYVKILSSLGLREGDVVGLCSENTVEMACIVYSTIYLGLTLSPLNFLYSTAEYQHMVKITSPKIIFCSPVVEAGLVKSLSKNGTLIVVIGNKKTVAPKTTEELFMETEGSLLPGITKVHPAENVAGIFSSSGTTGAAKGVACTQKCFLVDVHLVR